MPPKPRPRRMQERYHILWGTEVAHDLGRYRSQLNTDVANTDEQPDVDGSFSGIRGVGDKPGVNPW